MNAPPKPPAGPAHPDPWNFLARLTAARIGLGRAGGSLPTAPLLEFQFSHARARDAVQRNLDTTALSAALQTAGFETMQLHSAARDRSMFIARPDLGRILDDDSKRALEARPSSLTPYDCAFVIADGLSALAVESHAVNLLQEAAARLQRSDWSIAPIVIVQQGRVAVADEIGALLPARVTVLLIGERPGLSSPDSLGVYLTYEPLPGRTNAERNCISNIRSPGGLSYTLGAHKLVHLMTAARQLKRSGIELKENAPALPDNAAPAITG